MDKSGAVGFIGERIATCCVTGECCPVEEDEDNLSEEEKSDEEGLNGPFSK